MTRLPASRYSGHEIITVSRLRPGDVVAFFGGNDKPGGDSLVLWNVEGQPPKDERWYPPRKYRHYGMMHIGTNHISDSSDPEDTQVYRWTPHEVP